MNIKIERTNMGNSTTNMWFAEGNCDTIIDKSDIMYYFLELGFSAINIEIKAENGRIKWYADIDLFMKD